MWPARVFSYLSLSSIFLVNGSCVFPMQEERVPLDFIDVFVSGQDGYNTYRIPSIIRASNGDLLAFCEGRRNGASDTGDIDMLMKRSEDEGRTWSGQRVLWDDGVNVCGNPCPVVDSKSGTIFLLMTHNLGSDHESQIIAGESTGTRTVWVMSSPDHGHTWTEPKEITATTKKPNWTWYATGPGAGIQLTLGEHRGRLVIPCDHIEAETRHYYSHVIYSDDGGQSWELGGRTPQHQVNECEVVELANGQLLLNMRNYDRSKKARRYSLSEDGGNSWSEVRFHEELVEPICQASIRRMAWPSENEKGLILFSNPHHSADRVAMTLHASQDEGKTWTKMQGLYSGSSAYSCLVSLPDSKAGCLFERDRSGRISYVQVDWGNWLSKNRTK